MQGSGAEGKRARSGNGKKFGLTSGVCRGTRTLTEMLIRDVLPSCFPSPSPFQKGEADLNS